VSQRVGIDEHGLLELAVECSAGSAEALNLVVQFLELALGSGAVDGLEDVGGVPVERLPTDSGALGLSGDRTVGPVEDGSGVGDAKLRR
jgi:hypothetical protein